tara:strand:- start:343 stop:597 length:255 start_codon:yes stop_codon:yes gene_type:complete
MTNSTMKFTSEETFTKRETDINKKRKERPNGYSHFKGLRNALVVGFVGFISTQIVGHSGMPVLITMLFFAFIIHLLERQFKKKK